jgi:preprotein translocase subunit SecY
MSSYPPFYAYPSAPPVVRAVPDPPHLHWGIVFALSVVTFGVFGSVWLIVQANWVRKVYGRSKALPWAIVYASVIPLFFLFAFTLGIVGVLLHLQNAQAIVASIGLYVRIVLLVLWIIATFTLSGELSTEPIGIPLSGFMTFFFGPVYFQYHLYDYEVPDAVHQFRGPLRTELEIRSESSSPEAKA